MHNIVAYFSDPTDALEIVYIFGVDEDNDNKKVVHAFNKYDFTAVFLLGLCTSFWILTCWFFFNLEKDYKNNQLSIQKQNNKIRNQSDSETESESDSESEEEIHKNKLKSMNV